MSNKPKPTVNVSRLGGEWYRLNGAVIHALRKANPGASAKENGVYEFSSQAEARGGDYKATLAMARDYVKITGE